MPTTTSPAARALFTKDIRACIDRLKGGKLVAIPTETVYGLAADAWNTDALELIFAAKERPKSDPLIIHVKDFASAELFWEFECTEDRTIVQTLASQYWPGPLTMVANAKDTVPSIVTAGTGMVAVRSPLLHTNLLEIPLAAPSANKFGHVSPTTAQHVYDDLSMEDVWILEHDDSCNIGVESTVVQISHQIITMLRHGGISAEQLRDTTGLDVQETPPTTPGTPHVAPGQTIQHYSPKLPSFLIDTTSCCKDNDTDLSILRHAVVLDIHHALSHWRDHCGHYLSLGETDDAIAQSLFRHLRWAESQPNVSFIVFPHISQPHGILHAVADRLHRAASGNVVADLQSIDTLLA